MFTWKSLVVVALGGAIGSVARYKIGGLVLHHTENWDFPLSTFAVNLLGCFVIGLLAAVAEHHDLFSAPVRLFLFTGLLGGFTTFSAFGYESVYLVRRHLTGTALAYVILSVTVCLTAVLAGMKLIDVIWPWHR